MSTPMDEDDEIVQELDVYFAPDAAPQLYVLQFPGKRADDVNAIVEPLTARLKPRHNMLQLDLPLPQAHQQSFHRTDTRRFDSQTVSVRTHMCLAQVVKASDGSNQEQLHLVPLEHIHQMRPNFSHVDAQDMLGDDGEEADAAMASSAKEDAAKANKPVTFQRKESERAAQARMNTYAFQKASQDAEAWIDLQVVSSELQRLTLEGKNVDTRSTIWKSDATTAKYLQTLNYGMVRSTATEASDAAFAASTIGSIEKTDVNSKIYKLAVVSKLTTLLKTGSPIPFSILASQFPNDANDAEPLLLEALNACAVLVRGNWCLHSRFLPRFGKIRTLLLLILHDDGWIDRRRLWDQVYSGSRKMHPNQLLALLQQIGKQRAGGHGWILQIADDDKFCGDHPEISQLHEGYWARQRQRFQRELALYNRDSDNGDQ